MRAIGCRLPDAERFQCHNNPNEEIRYHRHFSQEERSKFEEYWVKDGNLLVSGSTHWFRRYGHLEARALGNEPPTNPFCIATEEKVDCFKLACPPESDRRIPDGFTHAAINFANEHVKSLLCQARHLLVLVSGQLISNGEQFDYAAVKLDDLSTNLLTDWRSNALILPMRNASPENYTVAGIVKVTAHEALEELARKIYMTFRNAICKTAFSNNSSERDRRDFGPWHGHEVRGALPVLYERNVELLAALAPTEFDRHIANLDREHAKLSNGLKDETPAEKVSKKSRTSNSPDELASLYKAIRDLKLKHGSEGKIIEFIDQPQGKEIREMVEAELRRSPKTRGKKQPRVRTLKDVVRAALKVTYKSS